MIKFIELTLLREGKITFNVNHITNIQESLETGYTVIVTTDCVEEDMFYSVKETYEEVKVMLMENLNV